MSAMLRPFCCALAAVVAATALSVATAPADAVETITVTGSVFDQADYPAGGAAVWLIDSTCQPHCPETRADATGDYRFDDVSPGTRYCVAIDSPYDVAHCFEALEGPFAVPDLQIGTGGQALLTGSVTDVEATPITGAWVTVDGESAIADASGTYHLGGIFTEDQTTVTVSRPGYVSQTAAITIARGFVTRIDFQLTAEQHVDGPPSAAFTWSRNDGKLVVGGYAKDDVGVRKVRVAVRDLDSREWLHADGSWGRFRLIAASATDPGARRTDWRFKRSLRPGRYGVSLAAVDTASQRNAQPRPWRVVTVQR